MEVVILTVSNIQNENINISKDIKEVFFDIRIRKSSYFINSNLNQDIRIEIERLLYNDNFNIKVKNNSKDIKEYINGIQINNKDLGTLEQNRLNETKFHFLFLKEKKFNDVNTLAIYQNTNFANDYEAHLSDNFIFNKNLHTSDYFLENNQILKLSSVKKIINNSKFNSTIENDLEKIKNNVILIPNYLQKGKHNKKIFSIAIFNDDKSDITHDIGIVSKKLTNLSILKNESLDTYFKLLKNEEQYELYNHKIVGEIEILNSTYYDPINKVVKKGLGPGTQQGIFIPNDFIGELNPFLNIDINSDIKNINLSYGNNFYKINSDKDITSSILKINEINNFEFDSTKVKTFLIPKEKFSSIIKSNYSWKELKNIIIQKENEK